MDTHACKNGPYIFPLLDQPSPEGIGSSIANIKSIIILAQHFDLKVIPNPNYFINNFHKSNFFERLGWSADVDCSYIDVNSMVQQIKPIVHSIMSNKTVNTVSVEASKLLVLKLPTSKDTTADKINLYIDELRDICHKSDSSGDSSIVTSTGPIQSWYLHNKQMIDTSTVILLDKDYDAYQYSIPHFICTLNFLRTKFYAAGNHHHNPYNNHQKLPSRASRRSTFVATTIALHYRHGDTVMIQDSTLIGTLELSLPVVCTLLESLLNSSTSVLYGQPVILEFYSQGKIEEFEYLRKKLPGTNFILEADDAEGASVMTHFDGMVQADVLIASPSSFSSLIAALNQNAVILAPEENSKNGHPKMSLKFHGLPNLAQQKRVIDGDLDEFNYVFCNMKVLHRVQYVPLKCRKYLREYSVLTPYYPRLSLYRLFATLGVIQDYCELGSCHSGLNYNVFMLSLQVFVFVLFACFIGYKVLTKYRVSCKMRGLANIQSHISSRTSLG